MAEILTTTIVDDLTGSLLEESERKRVLFGVNGREFRLDVDANGKQQFMDALKPFMKAATELAKPRTKGGRDKAGEIRAWAKANGHAISDRGRIPADIQKAYDAAQ